MYRSHEITNILQSHADGGYSVNVHGDVPTSGYMVGGEVKALELSADHPRPFLTTDEWLEKNWGKVNTPGMFVGIWKDSATGVTYVDISRQVEDIHTAVGIALSRGELAIWDVSDNREIRTDWDN